jgi:hypothetical protein
MSSGINSGIGNRTNEDNMTDRNGKLIRAYDDFLRRR